MWETIRPWETLFPLLPLGLTLLLAKEEKRLNAVALSWRDSDLSLRSKNTLEETLWTLRHLFSTVSVMDSELSNCTATLSWMTLISPSFCKLVEQGCRQALVLVAVYCVLLKLLEVFW